MGAEPAGGHITDPGKEARAAAGIPVIPAFDGFRAFAILGVVAIHLIQISGVGNTTDDFLGRAIWGTFGRAVELLFIVSGFVVYLPTAARGGEFGRFIPYAIRRGARLLPAYWLIVVISTVLLGAFELGNPVLRDQTLAFPGIGDILSNLMVIAVPLALFLPDLSVGLGIDPPLWTLSSELAFYLVLPLVAAAFFRRPLLGLSISAVITLGWMFAFDNVWSLAGDLGFDLGAGEAIRLEFASLQQFPAWAFSFGLGMCGAVAWVRLSRSATVRTTVEKRAAQVTVAALALVVLCAIVLGADRAFTRESVLLSMVFSAAVAVLLVALSLAPASWQRPFTSRRVRELGDISYGIYLSHYVFITLAVSAFALPNGGSLTDLILLTAIVVPPTILYGYLSARYLEQPIRRWARKYGRSSNGGARSHGR